MGQIAWVVENMYFNVFIYQMFHASESDIALMVQASAIVATLTTLFIGALSDRLGKRKAFITVGYILWGVSILLFAALRTDWIANLFPAAEQTAQAVSIGITLVIVFDCVMTFFGSTANDACFNAWLTDRTDESNRGKAEGVNSMMPLLAILVVFGGTMWMEKGNAAHWTILFTIIGCVVLATGVLGFFLIDEPVCKTGSQDGYFKGLFYGFRPTVIREHHDLYLTLIAFTVFGISIQIFMPYLILYYTVSLGLDNYVLIMAPAIVLAAIATALYGRVYDRIGYRKALIPSLIVLLLGYAVLFLFENVALVFVGSLLMMCGYLCGMMVFGARIRDCTPVGMAGRFQGVRIIGQVLIPGVIGPEIGKLVLAGARRVKNSDDGTFSFVPNARIFLWSGIVLLPIAILIVFEILRSRKAARHA
jgi:MFS family permease